MRFSARFCTLYQCLAVAPYKVSLSFCPKQATCCCRLSQETKQQLFTINKLVRKFLLFQFVLVKVFKCLTSAHAFRFSDLPSNGTTPTATVEKIREVGKLLKKALPKVRPLVLDIGHILSKQLIVGSKRKTCPLVSNAKRLTH